MTNIEQAEQYLQQIMDEAYELWQENPDWKQHYFWSQLTEKQRLVVFWGNLNYQVGNGGFVQWDDNGYSDCYNELIDFLYVVNLEAAEIVKSAYYKLSDFDDYRNKDEELSDYWYALLDEQDDKYYAIEDQLMIDVYNYVKGME